MFLRKCGRFNRYGISLLGCVVFCLSFHSVRAQNEKELYFRRPLTLRFTYQLLHSTHSDNFKGGSFDVNVGMTKHITLGIGAQYAGTRLHGDNGWVLTNLRLLPVYLNSIYTFCTSCTFQPYIHTEEGISFNHYNKLDSSVSYLPFKVKESGLYLSGNVGMNISLFNHFKAFSEIGYKGFKHSINALDVNPHGFTMRAGLDLTSPL